MSKGKITILGINGHVGRAAASAFLKAGWSVSGFGRSNRHPQTGVEFIAGDAESVDDLRAAIAGADVVFNGLNLPYDKWFNGRAEAQLAAVIAAMGSNGKTMLYPGNVYNYAASDRLITSQTQQRPERPRGEIRVRMEAMLRAASAQGDFQTLLLRAGDFYGPGSQQDWFDQLILREAGKGKVTLASHEVPHSWAYLPDLARAFVVLAEQRQSLASYEDFQFSGHFATAGDVFAAIAAVSPMKLTRVATPWTMLGAMGLFMPVMRELVKMRYLWDNPMQLQDARLDALLGPDFGTSLAEAMGATAAPFFEPQAVAA